MSFFKQGIIATLMLLSFFSSAQAEVEIKKMPQEAVIFEPQCEIIISQSVTISNARQAEDMMNGEVIIEIMTGAKKDIYNVDRKMHYTVTAPLHWETGTITRFDELGNIVYISEFFNEEETCETGNVTAEMQWISERKTSLIVKTNPSHFFYSAQEITVYFEDGTTSQEVVHDDAKGIFRFQRIDWDLNNLPVAVLIHNEYGDIDIYELKLDIMTFANAPSTTVVGKEVKIYDFNSVVEFSNYISSNEEYMVTGFLNGCSKITATGFDIVILYKGKENDSDALPENGEKLKICSKKFVVLTIKGHNNDYGEFHFASVPIEEMSEDGLLGDLVPPSLPILSLPTM